MQELHIWDLPHERVYIKLEEEFQRNLILEAKSKYGTWINLAKEMDCNSRSVMNWAYNKNFPSLHAIIKIASLTDTELNIIEKNVVAIATGRKTKTNGKRGKPIYNTKFPIKITPELARVLARFMGDGCIKINWYYDSIYYNKEETLIEAMVQDVKSIFGEMKISESDDNGTKCVRFPSIVGLIIVTMFGEVGTFGAKLSEDILDASNNIKIAFLQAYFDDEGTVSLSQPMVRYYTANPHTCSSLSQLLSDIKIKSGKSKARYLARHSRENTIYHVNVTGKDNVSKFLDIVSPLHPKKRKNIIKILSISKGRADSRNKILELFRVKGNLTKREIASYLNLNIYTVRDNLYELEVQKKIKIVDKKSKSFVWGMEEESIS